MPDPIRIEEAFHEAVEAIESAGSFRYIYSCFFSFTFQLEGEYLKYQSYLHQLMDLLPLYTLPVTWSGLDPEQLQSDAEKLQNISEGIQTDVCEDVIQRLREVSFLQYICISEPEKADYLFDLLTGYRLFGKNYEHVKGSTHSNISYVKDRIRDLASRPQLSTTAGKSIERLQNDIDLTLARSRHTMLIPVVEDGIPHANSDHPARYGRLRRVRLLGADKNTDHDSIIRHYPVTGAEPVSILERSAITSWGRKKVEKESSRIRNTYFAASLHYDINDASHQGESGSMAVSAMWYTFLQEKADLRQRYTLAGDAAMTGDVDKNGLVLPVDAEGIAPKTEAVFFSWVNLLAVPAQQLREFEECLKKLKKRYPDRTLTLIGIENLDGIFYDRRLSQYRIDSRFRHALKKLKKEKFKTAGLPLIVVLLLVIARLVYGPVDKNPVIVDYEGSLLILKNASGSRISEIDVGRRSVEYFLNNPSHQRYPKFQLIDITNDGINELFYTSYVDRHMNSESFVKAWSVSGDSLIWEHEVTFEYDYPEQNAFLNSSMRVREVYILNTQSGKKLVFTANPSQYFQTLLNVFDLATGVTEQEFVHPGRIFDMLVVDLNEDGNDEMVLAGVSNAYWKAAIAVLEYRENEIGYAPATKSYIPEGLKPVHPSRYLLIPKSIIADYFEPLQKYNFSTNVNYDPGTKNLFFEVVEGNRVLHEYDRDAQAYFYFDRNLMPLGIGTSDTYDVAARDFYLEGKIPFEPDYEYFEALQDSIQYWDGEKFVYTKEYFKE
jgi:hypothetical protein